MLRKLRYLWNESPMLPLSAIGWSYLAYAYLLHALHIQTPPVCLFYFLTGVHCPLCGLTRAFAALMTGDVHAATALNVGAVPFFVMWLVGSIVATARLLADMTQRAGGAVA